jgi:hypothetical protein
MDCVLQLKLFRERCEIVGVGVHLVALPRLCGAAMPPPVVRNDSITSLAEEHHLSVPVVGSEGPAVTEHDGLAFSPVLVENLRTIFHRNRWHMLLSLVVIFCSLMYG